MRLFWFALKQCLNAFQTLAPARLATPAAGPFLPQNGRKNFASPHCASLQNFAFILVQASLKIALSCPFPPFPAFLHSSIPPRPPFITLHENSHRETDKGCAGPYPGGGFWCGCCRSGREAAALWIWPHGHSGLRARVVGRCGYSLFQGFGNSGW